jgi:hypothetical protein
MGVLDMPTTNPPRAAKRTVVWMIQHAPPPTPQCFDSLEQWQQYLTVLNASGEQITRRQDIGKWTTVDGKKVRTWRTVARVFDRIDICADCDLGSPQQIAKRQAGRCIMPPLPYRTQVALFDASTDTLNQQRDRIAEEMAKRKTAGRLEKAAAYLKAHGFEIRAPSLLALLGIK